MTQCVAILLVTLFFSSHSLSQDSKAGRATSEKDLAARVSEYVSDLSKADEFSGVVLIARKGTTIFEKAHGTSDREQKLPNELNTRFNLGSINKRFTKTAIHMLAAQGKLALTDPIGKLLPDYPNTSAAKTVTIQHLLDMRSGIDDFFGVRYEQTPKERFRTMTDYLPLFADKPLEFEPRTSRRYSNGGYIVLGAIIEKVTGTDYYTFVRENIFIPAGMLDTDAFDKDKEVPRRALGYTKFRNTSNGNWGSNYATLKWDRPTEFIIVDLSNFDLPSAETVTRQILSWLPR